MSDTKIILTEEESISTALWTVWVDAIIEKIQEVIDFSKDLTITDTKDKNQINKVKESKNGHVKTRNTVLRAFKSKRDERTQLNRDNLKAQDKVVKVIKEEEDRLDGLLKKVELEQLKEENALALDDRKEALKKCDCVISDEELLLMKSKDFMELLSEKRFEFVWKEEIRLQEERDKLAEEQAEENLKTEIKWKIIQAKSQNELNIILSDIERCWFIHDDFKNEYDSKKSMLDHEEEKQKLKDEQARLELLEETRKQAKIEAEKEAKKKLERVKEQALKAKKDAETKRLAEIEQIKKDAEDKRLADLEEVRLERVKEQARIKENQDRLDNAKREEQAALNKAKREKELMEKRKAFT